MTSKIYQGKVFVEGEGQRVFVDGKLLPVRSDIEPFSNELVWGHNEVSSIKPRSEETLGNYQLAIALLADALKNEDQAKSLCIRFSKYLLETLDYGAGWEMTDEQIIQTSKTLSEREWLYGNQEEEEII